LIPAFLSLERRLVDGRLEAAELLIGQQVELPRLDVPLRGKLTHHRLFAVFQPGSLPSPDSSGGTVGTGGSPGIGLSVGSSASSTVTSVSRNSTSSSFRFGSPLRRRASHTSIVTLSASEATRSR